MPAAEQLLAYQSRSCKVSLSSGSASAEERKITDAGFQFLLLDTYSQLWRLLREYIASGEEVSGVLRGRDLPS